MKNFILACVILVMTVAPSLADEQDDIALAEVLVSEIRMKLEADSRAYDRAVTALAATEEGKAHLAKCPARDKPYWGACMTDDEWSYHRAYRPLYDRFYDEELKALTDAAIEAMEAKDANK